MVTQWGTVPKPTDIKEIIGVLASVEVDHADTSPVEVLAASDAGDRSVLILVTGTEAASNGPDIDIGEADATDKFFEDFHAGAWTLGAADAVVGTLTAEKALLATIATAGDAGKLRVTVIGIPNLVPPEPEE